MPVSAAAVLLEDLRARGFRMRGHWLWPSGSGSFEGPPAGFSTDVARVVAAPPRKLAGDATADEEKGFQRAKEVLVSSTVSCAAFPSCPRRDQLALPFRQPNN